MSNELTPTPPPEDDGFHRSATSGRAIATYLKWTDTLGWLDSDGLKPPSPLLAWKMTEFSGRWKDRRRFDRPLAELAQLNAEIPESEWERQDGKLIPPWKRFVGTYFIDPATGKGFRWEHSTWGAQKAWDELSDAVVNMRILRSNNCLPLVHLTELPWKVETGLRKRPFFEIIRYKTPGSGGPKPIPAKPPTPQLTGPAAAAVETPAVATPTSTQPASAPTASTQPAPANNPAPAQPQRAKPKPPVNLAAETLDAMGEVEPVTTAEILDDEIPW